MGLVHNLSDDTSLAFLLNRFKKDSHPVGSVYMSMNSKNPSTLFGGTWEQITNSFTLTAGVTCYVWKRTA